MDGQPPEKKQGQHWESVHRCPKCGHFINLEEMNLRVITTGIVSCPNCDWSGLITIEIVEMPGPLK